MDNDRILEALKQGMKGERDSVTVYAEAALHAEGEVKAFFLERAEEERVHFNKLLEFHRGMAKNRLADGNVQPLAPANTAAQPSFVGEDFLRRVAESRWLSAAVSSAVLLELGAIRHYRAAAELSSADVIRELFTTLADWEDGHYRELLRLQEESTRLWFDAQHFEPF